jgi:hypothetical protein
LVPPRRLFVFTRGRRRALNDLATEQIPSPCRPPTDVALTSSAVGRGIPSRFARALLISTAMLSVGGCTRMPSDGSAKSAPAVGGAPTSEGAKANKDNEAESAPSPVASPSTFAEWRELASPLVVTHDRPPLLSVDAADHWLMIGDTLVVGFDRAASAVKTLNLKRGAARLFGRRGAGPLEYSPMTSIAAWDGDSVLLMDSGQARATVLSLADGTGRTFAYASVDSAVSSELIGRVGRLGLVFRRYSNNTERGEPGMYRAAGLVRVLDQSDGRELARLAFLGHAGVRFQIGDARTNAVAPIPLAPLFAVQSSRVVSMSGDSDSLFALGEVGEPRLLGRLAIPMVELRAADRQAIRARYLAKFRKDPPQYAAALDKYLTIPQRISTVGSLWSGADESLWIRIAGVGTSDSGSVWLQLLKDSSIGRCVSVPPPMRVLAFGRSVALVGEQSGEDDGTFDVRVAAIPSGCATRRLTLLRR